MIKCTYILREQTGLGIILFILNTYSHSNLQVVILCKFQIYSTDFDECQSDDTITCDNITEDCINTDHSYDCQCKDGYSENEDNICTSMQI